MGDDQLRGNAADGRRVQPMGGGCSRWAAVQPMGAGGAADQLRGGAANQLRGGAADGRRRCSRWAAVQPMGGGATDQSVARPISCLGG